MIISYVKNMLLFGALFIIGVSGGLWWYCSSCMLFDLDLISHAGYDHPSVVLDVHGVPLFSFELEHRIPVSLSSVSPHIVNAFVAAEDRQFFVHKGISWRGILRAIIINLKSRRVAQGASTITQQLVKMRFFSHERTFDRKIREQLVSWLVEGLYSKEQILEAYINHVYFGAGVYGVEAAARKFWNISARELSPAQAATLAGIVKSPQAYCPLYNRERSKKRRDIVLGSMESCGYISKEVHDKSLAEPLVVFSGGGISANRISGHVREMIRIFLEEQFGREQLYREGFVVQTTIDSAMQEHAEGVFVKQVEQLRSKKAGVDGALLLLDGESGGIRVLVGGYDFAVSQFNRALQARRQLGSLIKPVVYAAALKALGEDFSSIRVDESLADQYGWSPRNVTRRFDGPMTLAHALVVSNNTIPVRLFFEVGAAPIIDLAERLGLPGPIEPYPSLALGCIECAPVEVVKMFNVFVHQGQVKTPYFIEWVKNSAGRKVYRHTSFDVSGLDWKMSSQVLWVLRILGKRLSRLRPNRWVRGDFVCKTGTTNEQRSCWFVGATPTYTGVVYLGCDNNDALEGVVYSARHAMPLLVESLRPYTLANERFYYAPGLSKEYIDPKSGEPCDSLDKKAYEILRVSTDEGFSEDF